MGRESLARKVETTVEQASLSGLLLDYLEAIAHLSVRNSSRMLHSLRSIVCFAFSGISRFNLVGNSMEITPVFSVKYATSDLNGSVTDNDSLIWCQVLQHRLQKMVIEFNGGNFIECSHYWRHD